MVRKFLSTDFWKLNSIKIRSVNALEEFMHIRDTEPDAGIWMSSGYDYCEDSVFERPDWLSLNEHRELKSDELPKPFKIGLFYTTPMVLLLHLNKLLNDFDRLKCQFT